MDNLEHDASSSSPSDSLTIRDAVPIEAQERGTGARKTHILLSDGSSFFVRTAIWKEERLRVGDSVGFGHLEQLAIRSETSDAVDHGAQLLERRDHSRGELSMKLLRRDYSSTAVDYAVDELARRGYLDDLRFAKLFIEQRLRRRPEGTAALRSRLSKRGVDDGVIRTALSSVADEFPELLEGAAVAAATKLARRSGMTDDKIANALARRGFSVGDIRAALESIGRTGEIFPKNANLS